MRRVIIVFLGGGIGASLRALLITWLASWGTVTPVLIANVTGAFVLGVIFVLADEAGLLRAETRLFIAVGILGGYTTFSTFDWGADILLAGHARAEALAYLVASLIGGIVAVVAGQVAGRGLVALIGRSGPGSARRVRSASADLDAIEAEDREAPA
jgi:CrcB protein